MITNFYHDVIRTTSKPNMRGSVCACNLFSLSADKDKRAASERCLSIHVTETTRAFFRDRCHLLLVKARIQQPRSPHDYELAPSFCHSIHCDPNPSQSLIHSHTTPSEPAFLPLPKLCLTIIKLSLFSHFPFRRPIHAFAFMICHPFYQKTTSPFVPPSNP